MNGARGVNGGKDDRCYRFIISSPSLPPPISIEVWRSIPPTALKVALLVSGVVANALFHRLRLHFIYEAGKNERMRE